MACGFGTDGRDVRHNKLQGRAVAVEAEVETEAYDCIISSR